MDLSTTAKNVMEQANDVLSAMDSDIKMPNLSAIGQAASVLDEAVAGGSKLDCGQENVTLEQLMKSFGCMLQTLDANPIFLGFSIVVLLLVYVGCLKMPDQIRDVFEHEYANLGLFLLIGLTLAFQQLKLAVLLIVVFVIIKHQVGKNTTKKANFTTPIAPTKASPTEHAKYEDKPVEKKVTFAQNPTEEDMEPDPVAVHAGLNASAYSQ